MLPEMPIRFVLESLKALVCIAYFAIDRQLRAVKMLKAKGERG